MTNVVHWVVEFDIKDGQLAKLKSVMKDMVAATKANEPNTTHYEWFVSGDGKRLHIYERYANSAAVLTHMKTFGEKFANRLLATADPTRFVVYGDPSSEARAVLAPFGPVHMGQIGGFAR
jgi:quinol monooxygenase YgiN